MNRSLTSTEKKKFEIELLLKQQWTRKYLQIDEEKLIILSIFSIKNRFKQY
jgi:hypothetical protein